MGRTNTVNYALAATLVASGVTLEHAAQQTGAKNADSLRVGLARRNVTVTGIRSAEGNIQRLTAVANKVVSRASEALRDRLASELDATAAQLQTIKPGRSLKALRQRTEVLEPLARTAKIVHDWGNESDIGLVALGIVEQLDSQADKLACGVEPTTGSGVIEIPESQTPQG